MLLLFFLTLSPSFSAVKRPVLVFSFDQGFVNGVVQQNDTEAIKRMVKVLSPLRKRFNVYALLNPSIKDKSKLETALDMLKAEKLPFFLDVWSSDSFTIGSCAEHMQPFDVSHGRSLSVKELEQLKKKYGSSFAGVRIMETLGEDFTIRAVKTTNPEWAAPCWKVPPDRFFQASFLEDYLAFAHKHKMTLQFADFHWTAFADWDKPQVPIETEIASLFAKYPNTAIVTYDNNEPNEDSAKRIELWTKAVEKFKASGAKGFGVSNQSWLRDGEKTDVKEIIAWTASALKSSDFVQFESAWYYFKLPRGSFGTNDYKNFSDGRNAGEASENLKALIEYLTNKRQ